MSGVLTLPGVGRATQCVACNSHAPTPVRYIWHHILPEACGGATDTVNVVELCDNCHYLIHALIWVLKRDSGSLAAVGNHGNDTQRSLAQLGYALAIAANTVDKIPNEGSIFE